MRSRIGGKLARGIAVLGTALVLLLTMQSPVAAVGIIKHQFGDAHAADPWAGSLQLDHKSDHDHGLGKKSASVDPHADYDGPPIEGAGERMVENVR